MKTRISILSMALFALLLTTGTNAFATDILGGSQTTIGSNNNALVITTSKNVKGVYNAPADPATSYVLSLYHTNGKYEYATASSTGGIYWRNCADGDPCGGTTALAVGTSTSTTLAGVADWYSL